MKPTICAHCGRPIEQRAGPGRPREFCTATCRRAATRKKNQRIERSDPVVDTWLKECGI